MYTCTHIEHNHPAIDFLVEIMIHVRIEIENFSYLETLCCIGPPFGKTLELCVEVTIHQPWRLLQRTVLFVLDEVPEVDSRQLFDTSFTSAAFCFVSSQKTIDQNVARSNGTN